MRVLQTLALPLGYAALGMTAQAIIAQAMIAITYSDCNLDSIPGRVRDWETPSLKKSETQLKTSLAFASSGHRAPCVSPMRLLCLSNGHGEDLIALRILVALQRLAPEVALAALPLVGEGRSYGAIANLEIIGPVKTLPSGGFIYMDGKQLARDVRGGLLQLTRQQWQAIRAWRRQGPGLVLAVGDIVPLLFGWLSGLPYAFVGTAKSDYYLRDEIGLLPRPTWFERMESWSGSVYLPWERWLMSRDRCRAVFPRDRLTTTTLKRWPIPAFDAGNPMMDGLTPSDASLLQRAPDDDTLRLLLLPGSRAPEVYHNWEQLLSGLQSVQHQFSGRPLLVLGAIAPGVHLDELARLLERTGWWPKSTLPSNVPSIPTTLLGPSTTDPSAPAPQLYQQGSMVLLLSQRNFSDYLQSADVALAMAGTATEQFVGLGKPAIAIPGQGPQFTPQFAEAQSRLLGPSLTLVHHPNEVGSTLHALFQDPERIHLMIENGQRRMGHPGAAERIAQHLLSCFPT